MVGVDDRFSDKRIRCGQDKTAGFSLVELLVVIAVIGVLISLLLPAVQAARESARRVQCLNSTRQLSLAVLQYDGAVRSLPAAGTFAPKSESVYFKAHYRVDLKSGTNYSWIAQVLPYLEQTAISSQLDFSQHVTATSTGVLSTHIPALSCPSDGGTAHFFSYTPEDGTGNPVQFAKGNFAAFVSPFHVDDLYSLGAISLFGQGLQRISDGTSSTLLLGEIRTRENQLDQRGAWALPWAGSTLLSFDMHPRARVTEGDEVPSYVPSKYSLGVTQPPNGAHPDVLYECPDEAGAQLDRMPCTDVWEGYISAAPRSLHPGGVNVAYLDGHAGFLQEDIDEFTMAYMIYTQDEQVLDLNL